MGLIDDAIHEVRFANATKTATASETELIASPGVGKTIVIDRLMFSSDSTASNCSLTFKSATTVIIGPFYWGSPSIFDSKDGMGFRCFPGQAFNFDNTQTTNGNLSINVKYHVQG